MKLAGEILFWYACISGPICAAALISIHRFMRREKEKSRVTNETPLAVLFTANDHVGGSPWAA